MVRLRGGWSESEPDRGRFRSRYWSHPPGNCRCARRDREEPIKPMVAGSAHRPGSRGCASLIPGEEHFGMTKLPDDILAALQCRAARASLGASSMRGAGSRGVVGAGREFLSDLDLSRFSTPSERQFGSALDRATEGLIRAFPRSARHWGLARKGLNLFLRECLYTVYLRDAYNLGVAESLFEVPLDSFSGRALREASLQPLPRWQTVRGLEKTVSDEFQRVAARLGRELGIARVHLDAVWWGQRSGLGD
jgi:hypothetical protein